MSVGCDGWKLEQTPSGLARGVEVARQQQLSGIVKGLIQDFNFTNELHWLLQKEFRTNQGVNDISGSRQC
jgi:hypothetical protein